MIGALKKKMGNVLQLLFSQCFSAELQTTDDESLGYHGVSTSTVGVSVLAQHLYNFDNTSQVPEGLSRHVISSKKAQSNWYKKLSKAWRESKPPPRTPEEASRLVIHTLHKHQRPDVEGLLSFYCLPILPLQDELTTSEAPLPAEGLMFELHTLPVDGSWAVPDGDGVTVFVRTTDARESSQVPPEVVMAVIERSEAMAKKNKSKANALRKKITDAGYGLVHINNEEVLARKYRIRLRGIDAPENAQPFGKEAKDELVKILNDKCLKICVFDQDQYGRLVGDVYCNGIFVQKRMLEKGLAWHYTAYDKRPEFQQLEKEAKAKRIGLWALSDPEKPWEWRRNNPNHRSKYNKV